MNYGIANNRQTKLLFLTLVFLIISLLDSHALANQRQQCKDTVVKPRRSLSPVNERKQLGSDYSRVARFKLISRKKTYRVGEIINLDLAFMNSSEEKIFFRGFSDTYINLEVRDEKGNMVKVLPYDNSLKGLTSDSYILVEPDSIITWTYELLTGCQGTDEIEKFWEASKTLQDDMKQNKLKYQKEEFDRDLFVNFGLACLDTLHPGAYTITATAANDYVVVSPCEGNLKTVIGKITSAPLQITIVP
jgi:hypothetical protein